MNAVASPRRSCSSPCCRAPRWRNVGIMGGRGALTPGRGAGSLAREAGVQIPKYVNSVNLLIEHRQELSLSDSQFVRLIALKRTLDSTDVAFAPQARFGPARVQER